MRFLDEKGILRRKVHQIDQLTQDAQWEPAEVDIIETAFWARSVFDIIENVEFNRFGHRLKTTIRTTQSVDDPDHPGSAATSECSAELQRGFPAHSYPASGPQRRRQPPERQAGITRSGECRRAR